MDPSRALLHRYLTESSDRAFRDLVERHAGLVYQTALRRAGGDHALARDAAQVVFTDLAQKAGSLPPDTVLAGWLHRHTGFVTSKLIRTEQRRRQREHRAAMETSLSKADDESLWRRMAPVLDEALGRLSAADRDALVLRYLEGRDLREVGGLTGLSENSARMRVSRALEKLRRVLQRQGITSTTLALGTALGLASQAHAPAGLPQALATAALQAPATATGLAATLATWPWWGKAAVVLGTCAVVVVPFRFLTPLRPHETQTMVAQATQSLPLAERPVETPPLAEPLPAAPETPPALPPALIPAPPVMVAGGVAVISPDDLGEAVELTLGVVPAALKFDQPTLEVKAGASVALLFRNDKCPHQHNFLLINPGTLDAIGALADQMLSDPQPVAKHYLPESPEILARSTRLISIGQSELIEFTAPATPGNYPYVCTFPGHWRTMNGVLKVVPYMVAQATPSLPRAVRPAETPPLTEPLPAAPEPPLPAPPALLPAPLAVVAGGVAVISPAESVGAVKLMLGVVPAVMKFDRPELEAKAGARVMLLFRNEKCPLQHNFLLVNPGQLEQIGALADQMLTDPQAMAKHYLPESPEILAASSRLIGLGQSDLIEFTAPATPGDYPYLCTFPGHWRLMHGVLKVLP